MSGVSARTHSDSGELDSPSAQMTASIARPDSTLFEAAQTSSASTTSSRSTGAFMMAFQVCCTCMRENAEYMASNDAVFIVLEQTMPAARKAT